MDVPIGRWILLITLFLLAFVAKLLSSALINASDTRLKRKNDEKIVALLHKQGPTKLALALVRTFSLVGFAIISAQTFAKNNLDMWLVILILTPVFSVFLKQIPSSIGKVNSIKIVCSMYNLYYVLGFVLKPFTIVFSFLSSAFLRLFGVQKEEEVEQVTEEEIRAMVDIGGESGSIENTERDMIENVFDFGDMTAEDCMVHRTDMTTLWLEDSEKDIIQTIETTGLSRFPVYDKDTDDVVGILFSRDYLLNVVKNKEDKKPLTALLRDAYFVPSTMKADALLHQMQLTKTHMAIAVDEYGGVSGLVTLEDLLEEIVGDIYDEFDENEDAEILPLSSNKYRISGSAYLEDINEALQITLPENEDYDTLSGLFFSQFIEIPKNGTTPSADIYVTEDLKMPKEGSCVMLHIQVELIKDHRIYSALVTKSTFENTPNTEE